MWPTKRLAASVARSSMIGSTSRLFQLRIVPSVARHKHKVETTHRGHARRYLSSEKESDQIEECHKSLSQISSRHVDAPELTLELAQKLSPQARNEIVQLANSGQFASAGAAQAEVPPPTMRDLRLIALVQSIPFLGFGFMDNAILIIAGDAIDTSLGKYAVLNLKCVTINESILNRQDRLIFDQYLLHRCCSWDKYHVCSSNREYNFGRRRHYVRNGN